MDVLLLLGSVCSLVALCFTVSMVEVGSMAARSPRWGKVLSAATLHEVRSRGLLTPPLSLSDHLALESFFRCRQVISAPDADQRLFRMLKAVTDAADEELGELETSREKALRSSLGRQVYCAELLRRIPSHRLAACGWRACALCNSFIMAISGLRWFLPLFLRKMRRIGEPCLSVATFAGVWLGLLWWGLMRNSGLADSSDWLGIVGIVITLGVTIGLMVAIGRQVLTMWDVLRGPSHSSISKGVLISAFGIILTAVAAWLFPAVLSEWPRVAFDMLRSWLDEIGLKILVGGLLYLIALGWVIFNAIRWARKSSLTITGRVGMMTGAAFFAVYFVLIILFLTGASSKLVSVTLWVAAAVLLVGCASFCVAKLIEVVVMYCNLRARNVVVPRKGFRCWILVVWLGVVFGGDAIVFLLRRLSFGMGENHLFTGSGVLLALLVLMVMVAAFPVGFVVVCMYVCRIRRVYRETFASPAPPRAD